MGLLVIVVLLAVGGYVAGALTHQAPAEAALRQVGAHASAADDNRADLVYVETLAALDLQAVTMADLAESRGHAHAVQSGAFTIEFVQQTEYDTVTGWPSQDWKVQAIPTPTHVAGLASAAEIAQLKSATGAGFDAAFVRLMARSYRGAIAASQTELAHGRSAEAVGLAASLLVRHPADIAWLRSWGVGRAG